MLFVPIGPPASFEWVDDLAHGGARSPNGANELHYLTRLYRNLVMGSERLLAVTTSRATERGIDAATDATLFHLTRYVDVPVGGVDPDKGLVNLRPTGSVEFACDVAGLDGYGRGFAYGEQGLSRVILIVAEQTLLDVVGWQVALDASLLATFEVRRIG